MKSAVLHVEDQPETTTSITETVRGQNLALLEARSVVSARALLDSDMSAVRLALLDQRLPVDDDGNEWASEDQVFELACNIAVRVPIVWVTAHDVSNRQMAIPRCLGRVQKAGDVSEEVLAFLEEVIGDVSPEVVKDEVLVELSDPTPTHVTVRVPTWRPDEQFSRANKHLERWIVDAVREARGQAGYFRARAWLGAQRHGELDLTDWKPIPPSVADDESFWDDEA